MGHQAPGAGNWHAVDQQVFGAAALHGPVDAFAPRPRHDLYGDQFLGGRLAAEQVQLVHLPRPALPRSKPLLSTVLIQGNHGDEVCQLQQLLNGRLEPTSNLQDDGMFGTKTLDALLSFQRASGLIANGKADRNVWLSLLFGGEVRLANSTLPGAPQTAMHVAKSSIASWLLRDKFSVVLTNTGAKLPGDLRFAFEQLIKASRRKWMAETLISWAASNAADGNDSIEFGLDLIDLGHLGHDAFEVVDDLMAFLDRTSNAMEQKHLDDAAAHLARVVNAIGVNLFTELIARIAIMPLTRKGVASDNRPSAAPTPMRGSAISSKSSDKVVQLPDSKRKIRKPFTKKAAALQAARKAATPFCEICDE